MIKSPTTIVGLILILFALPKSSITSRRSYPHHVRISTRIEYGLLVYMCSGSIIADTWILTAATCCRRYTQVYYGSDFFYSGRSIGVKKTRKCDASKLALIETDKMVFGEYAQPIALPKRAYRSKNLEGTRCIFTGWAKDNDIRKGLAMGDVTLRNQNVCEQQFRTSLCGLFSLGSNQVANHGSPLVYDSGDGRILIGVYKNSAHTMARFGSLLQSSNVEWIKNVTGLFTDL